MIEFPEKTKKHAMHRAAGKCECTRRVHGHEGRCSVELGSSNTHYRAFSAIGSDDVSNCEVMCTECFEKAEAAAAALAHT